MFENHFKRLISLDPEEKVEYIIHHYWLTFLGTILKISFLPITVIIFLVIFGPNFLASILDSMILSLITLAIFTVWLTFSFYHWYIWYFDTLVLTDKKIILLQQKRLFERQITETLYERIQDVTANYQGILQNILKYGSISIQTAGETPNLSIKNLKKPQDINHLVLKLKDQKIDMGKEDS